MTHPVTGFHNKAALHNNRLISQKCARRLLPVSSERNSPSSCLATKRAVAGSEGKLIRRPRGCRRLLIDQIRQTRTSPRYERVTPRLRLG